MVSTRTLSAPAWGDLENFVYYLDFDLRVDADFFFPEAVLTPTDGCSKDESILVEQLQENTELPSAAESAIAGENPRKRNCLCLEKSHILS